VGALPALHPSRRTAPLTLMVRFGVRFAHLPFAHIAFARYRCWHPFCSAIGSAPPALVLCRYRGVVHPPPRPLTNVVPSTSEYRHGSFRLPCYPKVTASYARPRAWLVLRPGSAHPHSRTIPPHHPRHSLRLSARNSQRRAFDIGFAVKLTALLSALRSALHFATPCASCAMPVLSALPPHRCCLAALGQRLPTVVRFARSAPALNGCIAFSAFRKCRPFSTQDPRRSQCR